MSEYSKGVALVLNAEELLYAAEDLLHDVRSKHVHDFADNPHNFRCPIMQRLSRVVFRIKEQSNE